jgi:hypothetical protein
MLKWFGEKIPQLFASYGWQASLVVIVVLALLATGIVWFLGVDITALFR